MGTHPIFESDFDCLTDMILLEVENRAVEEALNAHFEIAKQKGRFDNVDAKICDFDGCSYHLIQPSGSPREILQLSLTIGFFDDLAEHGASEKLKEVYGSRLIADGIAAGNGTITLEFDAANLGDTAQLANQAARLKRNCFAAVFEKYFEAQANGSQVKRAVIHYRPDETMYVEAKSDRVTVIFSTIFKDASDIILSEVFMREFREGKKASHTAPTVLFNNKEPPLGLKDTDARTGEGVGYITFVLFPRHTNSGTRDNTIDLIHLFRDYLHYHLKCSKAYIHSRMRAKTSEFLKVLNRAKIEEDSKKKPSMMGPKKPFV